MRPIRPAFAVGAVAALFVGGVALATSRNPSNSSVPVQPPPQQIAVQPMPAPLPDTGLNSTTTATPLGERVVYRERVVTQPAPRVARHTTRTRVVTTKRSGKKSALIIGGSAAGGAITGGLIGGKKGAVIGGLIGGGAGTVYDRKTRKKTRVVTE
jgi:uncharacterized protein YcfJ